MIRFSKTKGEKMIVSELIEELKKCNPEDIVMYNFENSFINDNFERFHNLSQIHDCECDCSVDKVLIGNGTLKGFVFLEEELIL